MSSVVFSVFLIFCLNAYWTFMIGRIGYRKLTKQSQGFVSSMEGEKPATKVN